MSKLKCIIIEDEPLATEILAEYVAQVPFMELQQTFKDALLATEWLHTNTTDLIFLDIHLPKLKGLAFLKTLASPPDVIITTAYHQYAVESFEVSVNDYLLKPIEFERFLKAVNKVQKLHDEKSKSNESADTKNHIYLKMQRKNVKIPFSDILYIESQREYIKIITTKKEYISKMTTNEIEQLLPVSEFKRIHRSFIVSASKIDSYNFEEVEVNGVSIPIGREYRSVLDNL